MTDYEADKNQNEKKIPDRDALIVLSCSLLEQLEKKISGRYRPGRNEAMYLQSIRAITGLIDTTNRLIRDSEQERQNNPMAFRDQQKAKTTLAEDIEEYIHLFGEIVEDDENDPGVIRVKKGGPLYPKGEMLDCENVLQVS